MYYVNPGLGLGVGPVPHVAVVAVVKVAFEMGAEKLGKARRRYRTSPASPDASEPEIMVEVFISNGLQLEI